jgi:dTDP-L-rhamnose 4-epimerase
MAGKILITGGAGFIGSNLALELINKDYCVTVLDNLSEQVHGDGKESPLFLWIKDKVNFIKGDVRKIADWEKALKDQDTVVHLAAETGTGQSMYEISRYVEVNIQGTAHLLHFLANNNHSIQKVIIASSRAVYGEGKYFCEEHGIVYPAERREADLIDGRFECTCPVRGGGVKLQATDEQSKLHPTSVYGITKHNQEQMVLTVCRSLCIPAVVYRYQNVYGPRQSLFNPYTGILSIFSTQIRNNNQINIFEDGKESRDFVYIDDVVHATILGIENDNIVNEAFNIGAGKPIDVLTVARTLLSKNGCSIEPVITGNFRLGDIRHNYADLTKAKEILDFVPIYDFATGVSKFVEWVNAQSIADDKYSMSIKEMKEKGLFK